MGPVAATRERSTPRSFASLRMGGFAMTGTPESGRAGAATAAAPDGAPEAAGVPACPDGVTGVGTVARFSCAPPGDGCRLRRVAAGPDEPWPTSTAPPPPSAEGAGACDATVPEGGAGTAGAAGAPDGAGADATGVAPGVVGADDSGPGASVWITRIGVPTLTVSPSSTRSSETTPSNAL